MMMWFKIYVFEISTLLTFLDKKNLSCITKLHKDFNWFLISINDEGAIYTFRVKELNNQILYALFIFLKILITRQRQT